MQSRFQLSPEDFEDQSKTAAPSRFQLSTEDFNPSPQVPQESLGHALITAPAKMYADLKGSLINAAHAAPGYLEKAKTEIPGLLTPFRQHPLSFAKQALAGTQEGINQLAQFPLDAAKYLGPNRLNILPQSVPNAIAKITPEDTTQAINQLFGQPQYPGEAAMRGIASNLPIMGAGKALTDIEPSGILSTKKSIANSILNKHDALENKASQGFQTVSDEVNKRGIPPVVIDKSKIDDLSGFFPKTKQANALLDQARSGDYNALRKIQSDLFTEGKKNLSSDLETDRMRGRERFEKRDEINQAISDHLNNTGNNDLADLLNQSRNDYKTLQDVYYNANMPNAIKKMVDKNVRKIPNNLIKVLQEDSNPMQQLRNFHPNLESDLRGYAIKNNAMKTVKKYAPYAVGGAIGADIASHH